MRNYADVCVTPTVAVTLGDEKNPRDKELLLEAVTNPDSGLAAAVIPEGTRIRFEEVA